MTLSPFDMVMFDWFGDTLAMERGILVAGSRPDGVYVFERRGDRWIETEKLQGFGANGARWVDQR